MKNLILKQGDSVQYFRPDVQLDYGFKLESVYTVNKVGPSLVIDSGLDRVVLVDASGNLTDHADHFRLVSNALPRGIQ